MTCIKICGINSEAAFDAAVEAGADCLGFVFFSRSPRFVTPRQAASLSARHQGRPLRAGLFVEPKMHEIQTVLDVMDLDALQIYGDIEFCQYIQTKFGVPVWRAVGVKTTDDLPRAPDGLTGLVIEGRPPADATRPGGNASAIDWQILSGWDAPQKWLLAGGLTAENVAEAIAITGAPAVDVSSGVESLPGVKSPVLIRRFIASVRSSHADAELHPHNA
jgi:phosphoribosylanthranilate isomerase